MISKLYEKTQYIIPSDFIITPIYEYDISKANISILLQKGVINRAQYNAFCAMPKRERQIKIGLMQKNNPLIIKILEEGFIEARRMFVTSNNIQDEEIVSIKKDAMFIVRPVSFTTFGYINFSLKHVYSMMAKIGRLECYYTLDPIKDVYDIDIKGIKDEILINKHQSFYITLLCELFFMVLDNRIEDAIAFMVQFAKQYDLLQQDLGFYREFNSESLYSVKSINSIFYLEDASNVPKETLNIEFNRNINRELIKLLTEIRILFRGRP